MNQTLNQQHIVGSSHQKWALSPLKVATLRYVDDSIDQLLDCVTSSCIWALNETIGYRHPIWGDALPKY